MAKINITKESPASEKPKPTSSVMAFSRINYLIIIGGVAMLIIGYLLMIGGGSDNPNEFSEEIFSTRRITVSPIVLILGFLVVLAGIMYKAPQKS